MSSIYLSRPSDAISAMHSSCRGSVFEVVDVGIVRGFCLFGIPLVLKQFNPNFKTKWYLRTLPILSCSRKKEATAKEPLQEEKGRPQRIYINIGSLPYYDNHSGIPRVAKELCRQGWLHPDVDCWPVYPDPRTGQYRIALHWMKLQNFDNLPLPMASEEVDPELTVRTGDWLIHTMINSNEIAFMDRWLIGFRNYGGRIGYVLHDLIPEEFPHFYKKRDVLLFRRWLQQIVHADGIFAISQATKDSFIAWTKREKIEDIPPVKVFHLGANFKKSEAENIELPENLMARPFFLQVSTIEPRKGYGQLIKAFELLWSQGIDVNLALVGREGWKVRILCRYIRCHPELGKRLFWFPRATDEELISLYKKSRAVVVASEMEGFGLSVSEGLFYGKDMLLRDIPVFREVADDGAFYFSGKSPNAISNGVRNILLNRKQEKKSGDCFLTWKQSFEVFIGHLKGFNNE